MDVIRSCLFPHKGHKLVEFDLVAAEVRVSNIYNKDSNLYEYIVSGKDMHKDIGCMALKGRPKI
jgi:DNA polymerase I-like protein with 3'-5' exonuclease and polymerase domains